MNKSELIDAMAASAGVALALLTQLALLNTAPQNAYAAATLQEWEQGRRRPSGAAQTLLAVAQRHPEVLRELVA